MDCQTITRITSIIHNLQKNFGSELDWNSFERSIRSHVDEFIDQILQEPLQLLLKDRQNFLPALKQLAKQKGLRFCEFRKTSVRIITGRTLSISSPYFVKAKTNKKRKKAPNGSGSHLGLEVLGFIERTSANLVSYISQLAILCPSFSIAVSVLREQGISLDVKTARRLCKKLGQSAIAYRGEISFKPEVLNLRDLTVLICMDGGRLRQRTKKRGRKPDSLKRQGYHTDWVEPKLLTIQFLDSTGKINKDIPAIYDATLGGIDSFYDLLYLYLQQLDLKNAGRIVFCADGAPCLWNRIPALMQKLEITNWHEVLDYTHAKQNLYQLVEMLPRFLEGCKQEVFEYWKELLWNGDVSKLRITVEYLIRSPKKRKQALKKVDNYLVGNKERIQYSIFKELGLPTGSGAVESAIRRVINLRIKGAGIFWTSEVAEVMLFLRSQLLCGRWNVMLTNYVHRLRNHFQSYWQQMLDSREIMHAC